MLILGYSAVIFDHNLESDESQLISELQFPDAQCTSGNCINGQGVKLFGYTGNAGNRQFDRVKYEGEFKNSMIHGIGTLTTADRTFMGAWKDDMMHRQGTMV